MANERLQNLSGGDGGEGGGEFIRKRSAWT